MSLDRIRRSQLITTFGPGAMVDLPDRSVIISGLDDWKQPDTGPSLIREERLEAKICAMLGGPRSLCRPPAAAELPSGNPATWVTAFEFPEWFIAQDALGPRERGDPAVEGRSAVRRERRLVHRDALEKGRFVAENGRRVAVVPVRFVCGCRNGHVSDIHWKGFVHHDPLSECTGQLWLVEDGTTGEISEVSVRCSCGARRRMSEAAIWQNSPLFKCRGSRPWLGPYAATRDCGESNRLLIRTASNSYFPQVLSVISIPGAGADIQQIVLPFFERLLPHADSTEALKIALSMLDSAVPLKHLDASKVAAALKAMREAQGRVASPPVKVAEFEALRQPGPTLGQDRPDSDFHARELPRSAWDAPWMSGVRRVLLVDRLREVSALIGFTRFEPNSPNIEGEIVEDREADLGVARADIARDSNWIPAIENRGEGIFIEFDPVAIEAWMHRTAVTERCRALDRGFGHWLHAHTGSRRVFPGLPYYMIHTLSHLLMTALSLECGYPGTSLRERVYCLAEPGGTAGSGRYGLLIFTGSNDAEGTLGGLVAAGAEIRRHVRRALELGTLCSNDPICGMHVPHAHDSAPLNGSACHGCALVAETSCEQWNEFLDRSLVVPTIGQAPDAAFFPDPMR